MQFQSVNHCVTQVFPVINTICSLIEDTIRINLKIKLKQNSLHDIVGDILMGRPVHKQKIDNQINKPINKLTSLSLNYFPDQTDSKIFTKIRYVENAKYLKSCLKFKGDSYDFDYKK